MCVYVHLSRLRSAVAVGIERLAINKQTAFNHNATLSVLAGMRITGITGITGVDRLNGCR